MSREGLVSEALLVLVVTAVVGSLLVGRGLGLARRVVVSAGCVAAAAFWLVVSQSVEGRVLVLVTADRGLAAADLAAVPLLVVAVLVLRR